MATRKDLLTIKTAQLRRQRHQLIYWKTYIDNLLVNNTTDSDNNERNLHTIQYLPSTLTKYKQTVQKF